jgi:hypothetical protein
MACTRKAALRRPRQEDSEFKASLGYIENCVSKKRKEIPSGWSINKSTLSA